MKIFRCSIFFFTPKLIFIRLSVTRGNGKIYVKSANDELSLCQINEKYAAMARRDAVVSKCEAIVFSA